MTITHIDVAEENKYYAFGYPDRPRLKQLPAGMYRLWSTLRDKGFEKIEVKTDKLISLKKSVAAAVTEDIKQFLTDEVKKNFADYEMLYRRGVLLYGPPGTGKTSAIIEIARDFIDKQDGIVVMGPSPKLVTSYIKQYREADPGRPFMVVFEEMEDLLTQGYETDLLNLLDGQNSLDNVIFLATTNYIKKIPDRIKKRPSRFARCIKIGSPPADIRKAFLEQRILPRHKVGLDINKLVEETSGFTIDHLKDLIVTMFCFGQSSGDAIKNIRDMLKSDEEDE